MSTTHNVKRIIVGVLLSGGVALGRFRAEHGHRASVRPATRAPGPLGARCPARLVGLGVLEQIRRDGRLGVGDALLLGLAVGHRQQAPNTACHSIFRHRRVRQSAQLLQ
jgi:hypothetical protein